MKITLFIVIFFIATTNSSIAATQTCESYQNRINHLKDLNARGGKPKQLASRTRQINQYEEEVTKCSRIKTIGIVTNSPNYNIRHQKLRSSKTQNPQLQKLIKTCNYWIEQNNTNPSWDNTNYRDTACRAADEATIAKNVSHPQIPNPGKLKDCIKPNNVIDDDVNACIAGNKKATWKR